MNQHLASLRRKFGALGRVVPDSLFGRLAILLVGVALVSHVLALSLLFEFRPSEHERPPPPPPTSSLPHLSASGQGWQPEHKPPLADGPPPGGPPLEGMLLDIGVRLGAVLVAAWIAARWLSSPLHRLAEGTRELAHNIHRAPLDINGTRECREAGGVINQLQQSVLQQMSERDQFVAAVSHDLRTPLTRLALRAEGLDDANLRERFRSDIREMETMIRATLGYLCGDAVSESPVNLDLVSVVQAMVDDRQDCGQAVHWRAPEESGHCTERASALVHAPLLSIRRAIDNLIDNALFYGTRAELVVSADAESVTVSVLDQGPGIPEDAMQKVLQPFYRLEGSRNRHTGGTGLGLAVVDGIVRRLGGQVQLSNRAEGGLNACLQFPRFTVQASTAA